MNSKTDNKRKRIFAAAAVICALIVIMPTASAGLDIELPKFDRTIKVGPSWGNIQWKDTFNSKIYTPVERTIKMGTSWANTQWNDKFNGKSYAPLGRTINIGPSWLNFKWTDSFNSKSYLPSYRDIKIGPFSWSGKYDGTKYIQNYQRTSLPISSINSQFNNPLRRFP